MAEPETELEKIVRLTYEATQALVTDVAAIREDMPTKVDLEALATKFELKETEDRLATDLKEVKADIRTVIADETANSVAIARLEKRAGLSS